VAICTVGRPSALRRALQSLEGQTVEPGRVLVVADGEFAWRVSRPVVSEFAESLPVEIVRSAGGLVAARRCVVRHLQPTCRVVFYIDDDAALAEDAIENLREVLDRDRSASIVGITFRLVEPGRDSLVMKFYNFVLSASGWFRLRPARLNARPWPRWLVRRGLIEPADRLNGAAMAIRAEILKLCDFDEGLGRYAAGEDVDLSLQLRKFGRLARLRRSFVRHSVEDFGKPRGLEWGREAAFNYFRILSRRVGLHPGRLPVAISGWLAAVLLHLTLGALGSARRLHFAEVLGLVEGAWRWIRWANEK